MKRIVLALTCMIGASVFMQAYSSPAGPTTGKNQASAATDMRVESQQPINADDLPAAVVFTLADTHPGARIVSIYLIEGNEGKLYRVVLTVNNHQMTLFLNDKGKIIN